MRISLRQPAVFALLVASMVVAPAMGGTTTDVVGTWNGAATTKVRVRRVGGDRTTVGNTIWVYQDSTWESADGNGWEYSGPWSVSGRKLLFNFDADGRTELVSMLEAWAATFGVDATVTLGTATGKAKGKVNRRGTFLKHRAKVKFTISAAGRTRRGSAKIKGIYTPLVF